MDTVIVVAGSMVQRGRRGKVHRASITHHWECPNISRVISDLPGKLDIVSYYKQQLTRGGERSRGEQCSIIMMQYYYDAVLL